MIAPHCSAVMLHRHVSIQSDVEIVYGQGNLTRKLICRFPNAIYIVLRLALLMTWYKENAALSGLLPLLSLLVALRILGVSIGDASIAELWCCMRCRTVRKI
eukprot:TRINITY_DN11958_c0_g1_i1.p3 TRINITY_DN11958_c0_g1~~TRINITY_DN11958_c0_g1_i1.p3  ORF type:complete len:102 (+),score=0.08 TRINITY_DN11958_c0_g1_i1:716-1021(+)